MFDCHKHLNTFHDEHVRLNYDAIKQLAEYREINLQRLKAGLDNLEEQDNRTYAPPLRHCNQGSYAMHTMIQNAAQDYDLDIAIVFRKNDLPGSPLAARHHIAAAFNTLGLHFKNPPEARTNAVTIWYAEGYHLDFAVYREVAVADEGVVIEHAGAEWSRRDPMEITKWFNDKVRELSPPGERNQPVAAGQLRRIVRWLKACAKVQTKPQPGGLLISVMAVESYQPNMERDDVALYNTMVAIWQRGYGNHVYNPVDCTLELTNRDKYLRQVANFRTALAQALQDLQILFQTDGEEYALAAWNAMFQHEFWTAKSMVTETRRLYRSLVKAKRQENLRIRAEIIDGPETLQTIRSYPDNGKALPKGTWLKFGVAYTSVRRPYQIRWIVQNYGVEAEANDDLGPRLDGHEEYQIEHAGYTGSHILLCEIVCEGMIVAQAQYLVNVA